MTNLSCGQGGFLISELDPLKDVVVSLVVR
jgi:hypothetical protein